MGRSPYLLDGRFKMPEFVYIESKSFKFSSKNDIICLPKHILSLSEVEQIRARNFVELVRTIY